MKLVRFGSLLITLLALPALAGVKVPGDLGIGPAGFWFVGPLIANRGAVPHFGLVFDLQAIIDRDWINDNQASIPDRYKGMADKITELKIGASIFIPSTLFISPPIDALGSVGLFGATWAPLGLTLVSTGQKSSHEWNNMWLSLFAFLQFHVRFPYEVSL